MESDTEKLLKKIASKLPDTYTTNQKQTIAKELMILSEIMIDLYHERHNLH